MKGLALARSIAKKSVGVPSISEDGTFITAPIEWLPWFRATSGSIVSEEGSLALPTIYACVRVLSEDVASLPLILYRRLPDGGRERATDHPLYNVFHDAPNPAMTSFTWRETLMTHLLTWGNAYCEIAYDAMDRLQLWPLRPSRMTVKWENGAKAYYYLRQSGEKKRMADGTVFHVMGQSLDGLVGLSPIALHRATLGEQMATRDFGQNFYRNMARPATVLKHPKSLSTDAANRLKTQIEELKGSRNAGKTVVLEEGLDFAEIGIPPEDAQYVETRKLQREEAAQIYRMQQHKVGILDHATFSNIEHQQIDYVTGTLRPWPVRIEQAARTQLFPDEPDIYLEHLFDALLRGDSVSRAQALQIQRNSGVINGDEWRELENLNKIEDGSGQSYWMPQNYKVATAEQPTIADPPAEPPQLVAVKSAAFRCPEDNRLLARSAPVGTVADCSRCKKTWTVTEAGVEALVEAA